MDEKIILINGINILRIKHKKQNEIQVLTLDNNIILKNGSEVNFIHEIFRQHKPATSLSCANT